MPVAGGGQVEQIKEMPAEDKAEAGCINPFVTQIEDCQLERDEPNRDGSPQGEMESRQRGCAGIGLVEADGTQQCHDRQAHS